MSLPEEQLDFEIDENPAPSRVTVQYRDSVHILFQLLDVLIFARSQLHMMTEFLLQNSPVVDGNISINNGFYFQLNNDPIQLWRNYIEKFKEVYQGKITIIDTDEDKQMTADEYLDFFNHVFDKLLQPIPMSLRMILTSRNDIKTSIPNVEVLPSAAVARAGMEYTIKNSPPQCHETFDYVNRVHGGQSARSRTAIKFLYKTFLIQIIRQWLFRLDNDIASQPK